MNYKIKYDNLPPHIQGGVQRYIEHGTPPGDFLTAVICNDLKESFGRADEENIRRMFDIVSFFYNQAPAGCWGSEKRMMRWIKEGGLNGRLEAILSDPSPIAK